jgi:hypothetical protein
MFPEKILFDGEKYRTNSYNNVLDGIIQNTNELQKKKTEGSDKKSVSSVSVPGAGIEPAQHCYHWCLRPARLPIPPSGRKKRTLPVAWDGGIGHPCCLAPRGICPQGKFNSLGPAIRAN